MDNTLTIKQLISEGKEISQGIRHIPARPNSIRYEAEFQLADDAVYERWKNVTLRFLSTNYSDDISVSDFRNAMDEFEKKHYAPQKMTKMIGILEALIEIPTVISNQKKNNVTPQVVINNNNNQEQTVNLNLQLKEELRKSLTGEQYDELLDLINHKADKKTIADKIKEFGINVAGNLLASIIYNRIL